MQVSAELRALAALGALALAAVTIAASVVVLVRLPPGILRGGPGASRSMPRRIARSALGVALILAGVVLAVPGIPGPGVLLIGMGILVADLPGKRRALAYLARKPGVLGALNAVRRRFHRPPLEPPA